MSCKNGGELKLQKYAKNFYFKILYLQHEQLIKSRIFSAIEWKNVEDVVATKTAKESCCNIDNIINMQNRKLRI